MLESVQQRTEVSDARHFHNVVHRSPLRSRRTTAGA